MSGETHFPYPTPNSRITDAKANLNKTDTYYEVAKAHPNLAHKPNVTGAVEP